MHDYLLEIQPGFGGYFLLALGAFLEYVFPPFPGDVVLITGAVLAGTSGWSPILVILVTILASIAGMFVDHAFGHYIRAHDAHWRERHPLWARMGRGIDRLLPLYRRHPKTLLLLNRFMPSVRTFIFLAAGIERTPRALVLGLGALSALAWIALLFAIGFLVGRDFDRLTAWVERWSLLAGTTLAVILMTWLWRQLRGQRPRG